MSSLFLSLGVFQLNNRKQYLQKMKKAIVAGAGLVGSLLSIILSKRGYSVEVYEKRKDPRLASIYSGRSINLALSNRGIEALKIAGVLEDVIPYCLPMKGRIVHQPGKEAVLQPYSRFGNYINSVSRAHLNQVLVEEAEKNGVQFIFNQSIEETKPQADLIFGADGIHSGFRKQLKSAKTEEFDLQYSYKEFHLEPKNGAFAIDPEGLHIWPEKSHMFIALPNPDKSFTCTLFLATEGETSFKNLNSDDQIEAFFSSFYPEIKTLIPDYLQQFHQSPTSALHYIKVENWVEGNKLLIGDAAHAIVPFYGQGMNAGFEDCRIVDELLQTNEAHLLQYFYSERKANADAICELALSNFIEMRDKVVDKEFLEAKKLENQLIDHFGTEWKSLYSMVTFSAEIPYADALKRGKAQSVFLKQALKERWDWLKIVENATFYI